MLSCRDLTCSRGGGPLFQPLSFALPEAALCQVIGKNGVGKTTLLRTLAGLLPIEAGEVLWQGESIEVDRISFQQHLFYLGHELGLKNELSAFENISLDLSCSRYDKSRLHDALLQMGLDLVSTVPCYRLSCGQKKRLALAKCLLSDAQLFILDEPFSGLDKAMVQYVETMLLDKVKQGASIILTSHQASLSPDFAEHTLSLSSMSEVLS